MISEESQEENGKDRLDETEALLDSLVSLRSPLRQQGVLLDMLAEVASKTLFDPTTMMKTEVKVPTEDAPTPVEKKAAEPPPKKKRAVRGSKTSPPEPPSLPLAEILLLPPHRLLRTFSRPDSNELRRTFSFTCTLEPGACGQTFTSFGSELRARKQMAAHLQEHVQRLALRPPEELAEVKVESPDRSSTLEKLLCVELIRSQDLTQTTPPADDNEGPVHAVRFDHCYSHSAGVSSEPSETQAPVDNVSVKNELYLETFMPGLMYEQEGVDELPLVPLVGREEDVAPFETVNIVVKTDPGVVVLSRPGRAADAGRGCDQEEPEGVQAAKRKPKGKAKFIGQSSSERALAMAMIDQIKRKQLSPLDSLECRICSPPRTFTAPTTLLSHYRSHAGIKPFECRICRAAFTRQHSLNYHLLIHSNQTRFTCRDCGRKFRHPSHFKEHQRRHTGESPFECLRCSSRFKTRNTYKRHLKTRHNQVLSPGGELTSSEPPFSLDLRESEGSVDASSPERFTPEPVVVPLPPPPVQERKPVAAARGGAKRGRKPSKRATPTKQQRKEKKEDDKEDIVKQAMRCSNINFESDEDTSPSNQVTLNHFTEIAQAILSEKGGNIVETQDNPAYFDNNNVEGGKTVEGCCEVDTILTFQCTAALSSPREPEKSKVEPGTVVVV